MTHMTRVIGIDLGTTHTAVAMASAEPASGPTDAQVITVVPLGQLIERDTLDKRSLLPSFLYFAHHTDGSLPLPWDGERQYCIGEHARARGAEVPTRVIASAKSWLCHPSVDRRSGILPLSAPEDVEKISPVEASFRILEHVAESLKQEQGIAIESCPVVLTVPASFDASARELTVEAATAAGIEQLTLLEEPQAALYAWIASQGENWRQQLRVGDVVLIVDIGGGTTDLTAVLVEDDNGALSLRRVAVGDHILLGGDNIDLLLGHVVAERLRDAGKELDAAQEQSLVYLCRAAKERLLSDDEVATVPLVLAGRGSKLLGNTIRTEISREDVQSIVIEGFFPKVAVEAKPDVRTRSALRTAGLPYAQDAAVTKHVSQFLTRQRNAVREGDPFLVPTHVLLNGGVLKSAKIRERLMACLSAWCSEIGKAAPRELAGADYDLAVARGAAAFALARTGKGFRIRGGAPLTYYVGVESSAPSIPGVPPALDLVCVVPHGLEEGSKVAVPELSFSLVVGEPVQFRFFASSVRKDDALGSVHALKRTSDIVELSPIAANLPPKGRNPGDEISVALRAELTEIGTLKLFAIPERGEPWEIELSIRENAV
jgi:hypothetical protein